MSELVADKSILRINQVGDAKPSLIIGGSNVDKFVPNINASFQFESGREQFWWNLNAKDVIVDNQKSVINMLDKTVSIRVGDIEERYKL